MVREAKLPTTTRALADYFTCFDDPVQAVVECTSNWYWLPDWCRAHSIDLTLAHSKMVKAISYAKVKTDKVDAKTLAGYYRPVLFGRPIKYNLTGVNYESSRADACG